MVSVPSLNCQFRILLCDLFRDLGKKWSYWKLSL